MKYKILAVPTHEHRQNAATAKAFEELINSRARDGWRLMPIVMNGWAVMERDESHAQSTPDGTLESRPMIKARPLSELPELES